MAKKSAVNRNEKRKKLVAHYYDKRQELKKMVIDPNLSYAERQEAVIKLQKLPKNSTPCRVRNRCQVTGRPRGQLTKYGLSRMVFRELAHGGYIPGMRKSSW